MLSITGLPFIPIHVILCKLEPKWSCRLFFAKVQQVPGKGSGSMRTWKAMCWIHAIPASCDASSFPIITLYYIQLSCVQSLRLLSLKVLQRTVNFLGVGFGKSKAEQKYFLKLERRRFLVFWILFCEASRVTSNRRQLEPRERTYREMCPQNGVHAAASLCIYWNWCSVHRVVLWHVVAVWTFGWQCCCCRCCCRCRCFCCCGCGCRVVVVVVIVVVVVVVVDVDVDVPAAGGCGWEWWWHFLVRRRSLNTTSRAARGGGGSFKNIKPIGKIRCCESEMSDQKHWLLVQLSNSLTN